MNIPFGEVHKVPTTIPFYFRIMTLRSKWSSAQAIGIHVGTLHKEFLDTILKCSPFQDIKVVTLSLHQKNPLQFEKHIHLHKYICNNSCTIKLTHTTEDSRDTLRLETSNNTTIADKVIDLAESSKTSTEGTFYSQCLQKHKMTVSHWINAFLTTCATAYPHHGQPLYPDYTNQHDHISAAATPTSTWIKYQSFLDNNAPYHSISKTTTRKSIPESIITRQNMSYIAATSQSTHRASCHSNVSSPTNSKATHETHRELLLETKVINLRNMFAQFKATQTKSTIPPDPLENPTERWNLKPKCSS